MTLRIRHSLLVLSLLTAACAGTSAATRAADSASLSIGEAERIIGAYRDRQPPRTPVIGSLDEVLEVLRLDQIDQFPAAVRFTAAHSDEPRAAVLQAQVHLAWGEAQRMLATLLSRETAHLREQTLDLERRAQAGTLPDRDRAVLERLRRTVAGLAEVSDGLERESTQHLAEGLQLAQKLIATLPSDYHGYRLAADYDRLRQDWVGFDAMMSKIEQLHPDSTGYVFLRGVEALERYGERGRAKRFLREALARDPKFARAQVQLLFLRGSIDSAFDEYEKLRAMSPNHQVVTWLGPQLALQHEESLAYKRRRASRDESLLMGGTR